MTAILTDKAAAARIAALYLPVPTGFDHIVQVDAYAAYVGITYLDGYDAITCRGSKTAQDWFRDALSEVGVAPTGLHALGLVPYGFGMNLLTTYTAIKTLLRGLPTVWEGHSLGCPEAEELAGAHIIEGGKVAMIISAAPPRSGTDTLRAIIQNSSCQFHGFANKDDPIWDLPEPLPPLLPWNHMGALKTFDAGPQPTPQTPLARHSFALYAAEMQNS